jgi:heme exporter protein A
MRLSVQGLQCVRGGRTVFDGVAFAVAGGEALCITGRNGAGKSSLLRQVAGLVRVAQGTMTLDGADPDLTIAEQAHYLGHQDALKPSLTLRENLRFWMRYLGGRDGEEATALAAVELDDIADLPAGYLSAGQRRRLSLARLVAVKRPIWLLDEPTSALDAPAQARVATMMWEHLAGGGMILAAVHGPIGLARSRELHLGDAS